MGTDSTGRSVSIDTSTGQAQYIGSSQSKDGRFWSGAAEAPGGYRVVNGALTSNNAPVVIAGGTGGVVSVTKQGVDGSPSEGTDAQGNKVLIKDGKAYYEGVHTSESDGGTLKKNAIVGTDAQGNAITKDVYLGGKVYVDGVANGYNALSFEGDRDSPAGNITSATGKPIVISGKLAYQMNSDGTVTPYTYSQLQMDIRNIPTKIKDFLVNSIRYEPTTTAADKAALSSW
jgi:hypothetical protein